MNDDHDRLHRSWRRWRQMSVMSVASLAILLALLPFGPDTLIFLLSVAPTNAKTVFVSGWIGLLLLASAFATVAVLKHRAARRCAVAAGVELKGRRPQAHSPRLEIFRRRS
jgi:hypothetical protein